MCVELLLLGAPLWAVVEGQSMCPLATTAAGGDLLT